MSFKEVVKVDLSVKVIASISFVILVFATWIGFVDLKDTNDPANRITLRIRETFKWRWLEKRFILTKIGLIIGLILGVIAIWNS